jgi:hypothetical protein
MTEQHIATALHRLLGERVPHLMEDLADVVSHHLLALKPAQAVVVELGTQRSQARGVLRRFNTLDAVHVHI